MLPNAAWTNISHSPCSGKEHDSLLTWPALCVPDPDTLGIRATARPVPQDSADV